RREEVPLGRFGHDDVAVRFQLQECIRGRVARLEFKGVGDVAEEFEAFGRRPEEGMVEHGGSVRAQARVVVQHAGDEVLGFPLVVAEDGEVGDVVEALDNIGFAHEFAVLVVRVAAIGEDVVEDAAEGENVDGAGGAAVGRGVEH
ncbi:MAG: hypothetical protein Q9193_001952, partial [Seirophora villosa]